MILFQLAIATGLIGLVLLAFGARGRRMNLDPVCRRCRYNLAGAPRLDRCPECGRDLSSRRAVRRGERRRRPIAMMCGIVLLIAGLGGTGSMSWVALRSANPHAHKPVWWLMIESRDPASGGDGARLELRRRFVSGALSTEQTHALLEAALDAQADLDAPWATMWGDIVESAWLASAISREQLERYGKQAFAGGGAVATRPRLHADQPLNIRLTAPEVRGASGPTALLGMHLRVGAVFVDENRVSEPWNGANATFSAGPLVGGARSLSVQRTANNLALDVGTHELRLWLGLDAMKGPPAGPRSAWPEVITSTTLELTCSFEIVPPEVPTWVLVDEPVVVEACRRSLGTPTLVVLPPRDSATHLVVDFSGEPNRRYDSGGLPASSPVAVAGDVTVRIGEEEIDLGSLGNTGAIAIAPETRRLLTDAASVEVLVHPVPERTATDIDPRVLGVPLVFADVDTVCANDLTVLATPSPRTFRVRKSDTAIPDDAVNDPDFVPSGGQWIAFATRLRGGVVPEPTARRLVLHAIAEIEDDAPGPGPGPTAFLEAAIAAQLMDEPGIDRFLRAAFELPLKFSIPTAPVVGRAISTSLVLDPRRIHDPRWSSDVTIERVRIDGVPVAHRQVGSAYTGSIVTDTRFELTPLAAPGRYEVEVDYTIEVHLLPPPLNRNDAWRTAPLRRFAGTVRTTIEVAPDAAGAVELVPDPELAPAIGRALRVAVASVGFGDMLQYVIVPREPPVNLAFDVFWRVDDREWAVGSLAIPKGSPRPVTAQARVPDFDPQANTVDVVLRSSAEAAIALGDVETAWRGEIVLPGVTVMRPGQPLPSEPPPPVTGPLCELGVAEVVAALNGDTSSATAARLELAHRIDSDELAPNLIDELVDRALTVQASDEPWANGWGDIVERAWVAGSVDDDTFARYARGAFGGAAALETRARVRSGALVPYRIQFAPARAGSGASGLRVHVATPVGLRLDDESIRPEGWGSRGGPPRLATPERPRRLSGSYAGPVARGPHTLAASLEVTVYRDLDAAPGQWPPPRARGAPTPDSVVCTFTLERTAELEVIAPEEPLVELVPDPALGEQIERAIRVTPSPRRRNGSSLSFALEVDALPVDCAFLAFARAGNGPEHALGPVIIRRGETFRGAFMVPAKALGELDDGDPITFVLRSDRSTAERSIGIERMWHGELTITTTAGEPP